MTDKILVLTTTGSEVEANKIAHALVERRLAACVNILPKIKSVYRWQEKIEESEEWLLVIKTGQELFGKVRDAIKELQDFLKTRSLDMEHWHLVIGQFLTGEITESDLLKAAASQTRRRLLQPCRQSGHEPGQAIRRIRAALSGRRLQSQYRRCLGSG